MDFHCHTSLKKAGLDNIDFLENTPDGQNTLYGTIIRAGALVQWLKKF